MSARVRKYGLRFAAVSVVLFAASIAAAQDRDAASSGTAIEPTTQTIRAVVAPARTVAAEDLARIGVRRIEASGRVPQSAESAEDQDESGEHALLERQFPPGAGTGSAPARPSLPQQVESFGYIPGSSYDFDGPVMHSWWPADPAIAAGPSGLVLATNITLSFCDTQGNVTYSDSLRSFFGCASNYKVPFDPKVVYDEGAGRFYMTILTYDAPNNDSELFFAISQTSNANSGWWIYSLRVDQSQLALDYEDIGFGPRGLYICGNYVSGFINGPPTGSHTNTVFVFDKSALLTGGSATYYQTTDLTSADGLLYQTIRAAQAGATLPAGLDGLLVQAQIRTSTPSNLTCNVWGVTLPANFPTSGPSYDRHTVDTDYPGTPPDAPQKGGTNVLFSSKVGANFLAAQYRVGDIFVGLTVGISGRAAARGIGIKALNWPTLSIDWQDDRSSTTNHYFFPGMAANAYGDAAISEGYSGSTLYGSMRGAFHPKDDPYWYSDFDVHDGDAYYNINSSGTQQRWGDYGGGAVDPVGQNFWLFHMYASTDASLNSIWKTRVAFVPRCVFVDVAASGTQTGSILHPWQSLGTAVGDVRPNNDLVIKAGNYPAGVTFTNPMRVLPDGGTVQIGP